MGKHQTADDVFDSIVEDVCWLHLIAMGELSKDSKKADSVRWFWKIREDCTNCMYNENCLCCLYTQRSIENVGT